ncbi:MAG TPA: fatty acid desaturase [Symbiobacteriaceae bacterium]|nr:fatty acid desaturase [Symbiobacteriaceae bacterium]
MQDLHTASYYTKKVTPNLPKEAFKAAPIRLLGGLAYTVFFIASAVLIAKGLPWYYCLPLSFLMGQALSGLGFLSHEIMHGHIVKNARLRDTLGALFFSHFGLGPLLWRKWHNMTHHAHTQHPHDDPDAMATLDELFQKPGLQAFNRMPQWVRSSILFVSFLGFFSVFCILKLKEFWPESTPAERRTMVRQAVVPYLFWLAVLPVVGPVAWFWIFLVPAALSNFTVITYITTNHHLNPHTEINDPLANSLSVAVPRWVDVLHFNFSYHTEHHLYPGMSAKWAPLVKAELKKHFPGQYHELSLWKAMVLIWKTPRVYHNSTELVDIKTGVAYPTLGYGMTANKLEAKPFEVPWPAHLAPQKPQAATARTTQTPGFGD